MLWPVPLRVAGLYGIVGGWPGAIVFAVFATPVVPQAAE